MKLRSVLFVFGGLFLVLVVGLALNADTTQAGAPLGDLSRRANAPVNTTNPAAAPDSVTCDLNYVITESTAGIVPGTTMIAGSSCDDCVANITFPFPFQLYDSVFTRGNVSSNGILNFDLTGDRSFINECLPYYSPFLNYAVFPLWYDLTTDNFNTFCGGNCGIFTSTSGTAPNRIFNIEWRAVSYLYGTPVNFEIRMYEGTSHFDIVYGQLELRESDQATVGAQRDTGSIISPYQCPGTPGNLVPGRALIFNLQDSCAGTPSPSLTPTNTPIVATFTATRTSTSTRTSTPTRTGTPSTTPTITNTGVATNTPSSTASATRTNTPTNTAVNTVTNTATNIPTNSPTSTPSNTPSDTPSSTRTDTPTSTLTSTRTHTATNTPVNTATGTHTSVPSHTATNTATQTLTHTPTETPSDTDTPTSVPTNTHTHTPVPTVTQTSTSLPTNTLVPDVVTVRGHVVLQGRPAPPNTAWVVPVTGDFISNLGAPPVNFTTTTDENGYFTVTGFLLPGDYQWRVKTSTGLANTGASTLLLGVNALEMGSFREGDANDDNCVNSSDFNLMKSSYGKSQGDPGYNPQADFNSDNTVSSADFNLLRQNYGQCGAPVLVTPTPGATNTATSTPVPTFTPTQLPTNTPSETATEVSTATETPSPTEVPGVVVVGHINIPGHITQSVPLTLTLRLSDGGLSTFATTSDTSGFFTATTALAAGDYTWLVKNPQTLAASGSTVLQNGTNQIEMGVLREGDANDDNCVNSSDFNLMKSSYGKSQGDPGYNPQADFTGDNTVSSADFNLLRQNYGQCGAAPLTPGGISFAGSTERPEGASRFVARGMSLGHSTASPASYKPLSEW